jgi:hypothetical protein
MRLTSANRMTPRSTARATKDIEFLPISKLKPYDKNARTHSALQTGLHHLSNRSRTCRNGNWKMASRE